MNSRIGLLCLYAKTLELLFNLVYCSINKNHTDHLALLDFKARITQDPLSIMSTWDGNVHFCQWYGVNCSRSHQRVTALNLRSLQLAGSVSPYIGNLSFLRDLNLLNNSFTNEIPSEISRLFRLRTLKLANNSFLGTIPPNISACSKLQHINVAFNQLEGEIPEEFGILSNLRILSMQKNFFSGNIPSSLGNLSSLEVLSAPENSFSGQIPDTLGQLSQLQILSIDANNLSGTLPLSICNLSSLITFSVVQNRIGGKLPSNLGITLHNLKVFAIAQNLFTGPIPSSFSNATNLVWLIMGENMLAGTVPSLGFLHRLQVLGLGYNDLGNSGANDLNFLSSLINSTDLWQVEIFDNNFSGVLPESIGNFSTTLSEFQISDNKISGRIPSGISNFVNLQRLDMFNNQLSGHIPIDIGKLRLLKVVTLSTNKISGSIPFSFGNLTLLLELSLSDNKIQGSIPSSLAECRNLLMLDLSLNNLNGTIPPQVIGLSSLSLFVDLSANYFTGPIPIEVGNLKNLGELGISDNLLSGRIPDSLGGCIRLEVLALQGNFFQGSIPSSLSSLRGLRGLDLSHNDISGDIPEFLQDFRFLDSLNLSYNNFEGIVPMEGCFKNASATLLMGNSKLCGGIPEFQLPRCNIANPKKKMSLFFRIVISSVCAIFGITFVISFAVLFCLRKKKEEPNFDSHLNSLLNVSYQSLLRATNGFSTTNLIGIGNFGRVYKGILDEHRMTIAVKVLNLLHGKASNSFLAECEVLRNIRHRNIVKVLSACSGVDYQGNDFKALIYEYMVNGSLDERLHPNRTTEEADEQPRSLTLLQRLDIAVDVASAIDYLHHQCRTSIIHCDIKPSNVLLDNDMNGYLGDFGLAKILSENTNSVSINQSSSIGVRGTIGYAPPEYGIGRNLSTYGDVYSYGILILELFTGKRPTDDMFKEDLSLHKYATIAFPHQVAEIAYPTLLQNCGTSNERLQECLFQIFRIGVACSMEIPEARTKIDDVVAQLHSIKSKLVRTSRNQQ
ncbi:Leucine-rich repeat protein kinase family protein [Euphorbia peplus]|nr:Leucine-rich repeat protein kinase family protein [Euphorbia peplus]